MEQKQAKQEAFNKVWTHFVINKNGPSLNERGGCVYRGLGGTKCAVGVLIPDQDYTEYLEGFGVSDLLKEERNLLSPELKSKLSLVGRGFLRSLQAAHDSNANWSDRSLYGMGSRGLSRTETDFCKNMESDLRVIASNLNLEIPSS